MRMMSRLAAVAVLAMTPLVSHAQSAGGSDHGAHDHGDKTQAAPGGMMGGGMMGAGMMDGGMGRMMAMMHGDMMGEMPLKHVEGRLAFLKTELKITPAQEPQWTAFADAVRSTAKKAQGATPPMMMGGMKPSSAPDRLGRYEKTLNARLEAVHGLKAAVDPLYASFGDEQKKIADELLMGPMGIM